MKFYRADGKIAFGPGQQLVLSERQLVDRAHAVKVDRSAGGKGKLVTALQALEFKAGEVVGLEGPPPRGLALTPAKGDADPV